MNRTRILILLGLMGFVGPGAHVALGDGPPSPRTEDVIYGRKFGTALTLDVFRPGKDANGLGLIFVVSGGWVSSHEGINAGFIRPFTDRGYTVFAVVHGSQPKFTIPEVLKDLNRAVRFIRHHAKEYEVDPDRLGIYGGSAGGHLSLMQGTAGDEGDPKAGDPVDRVSSRVRAVACFFPPTDFLNYGRSGEDALGRGVLAGYPAPFDFHELDPARKKFVAIADEARVREIGKGISPINHVSPDDPPTLIVHGDADTLVPIQQAEVMVAKLKAAGVGAKLVVKPGASHGWSGIDKDLITFADWFDEHLKKPVEPAQAGRAGAGGTPLPEPWSHRDIGEVAVPGVALLEDGTFTIAGTHDIWGKADGFHYVYRPLDGDGQVVARVISVENTNAHAKAGVMIRESPGPDARHASMVVTPVDGTQFLRRVELGGVTTNTNPGRDRGQLPRWVRLARKGDEFTASESADGKEWTPAGTATVPMAGKVLVGLVASSHQEAVTSTSRLDHATVGP